MFDILPNLVTSIITILFPVFASYKALRTSDPAQLTPWLMYWVTLSLIMLVESYLIFLPYLPFYAYVRLIVLSYLILPSRSGGGATYLYQSYIHPFLAQHEADIERFITESHDKAKAAGLQYLKMLIEWVKVNVLNMQPRPPTPPPSRQMSYAQNLLSRFNLPSAREGLAAPAGDFYSLLVSALQPVTSGEGATAREVQEDLTASGTLIPRGLQSNEEKMTYLTASRERLRVLLQAFDTEAYNLSSEPTSHSSPRSSAGLQPEEEPLTRSTSGLDFERISKDEAAKGTGMAQQGNPAVSSAANSWMPWNWGAAASSQEKGKTE